jgi:hypothetical protein
VGDRDRPDVFVSDSRISEFVRAFRAQHARSPRILHIGNIANNAYLNAKLLIETGCECDVICYDYYHIMGCPEWEDADFAGDVGDHFRPDWTRVDLHGFERQHWFVQGPQAQCLEYLIARNEGVTATTERLWRELAEFNQTRRSTTLPDRPGELRHWLSRRIFGLRFAASRIKDGRSLAAALRARIGLLPLILLFPFAFAAMCAIWTLRFLRRRLWLYLQREFLANARQLIQEFARQFPERPDALTLDDIIGLAPFFKRWQQVFAHYDVVIGYSTDGFLPLLAGKPYLAFEHGTLREIPFRQTGEGRRTALAYRMAGHVFVTNFDCLSNAAALAPGRHTLINHPFDEDHGLATSGWEDLRHSSCRELACDVLFFFPTRHDWVKGEGYADKANDVFLRGFAALSRAGYRVGAVCCEWGANVAHSKALLAELGVGDRVKWISPLPTVQFERLARAAHCVVDQFVLGSFGGVMFKAMAVGAPLLTYLEEAQLLRQYPVTPPVINCRNSEQVFDAMVPLLRNPDRLAAIGGAGRTWMKTYHSKADTVDRQAPAFAQSCGVSFV